MARFGPEQEPTLFSMTCDSRTGAIALMRGGASTATTMTVLTTATSRSLTITPGAAATLSARDPLLDAMAYSRGRFAVQVPGLAPLYLPSWPEVSRVIEDCR